MPGVNYLAVLVAALVAIVAGADSYMAAIHAGDRLMKLGIMSLILGARR